MNDQQVTQFTEFMSSHKSLLDRIDAQNKVQNDIAQSLATLTGKLNPASTPTQAPPAPVAAPVAAPVMDQMAMAQVIAQATAQAVSKALAEQKPAVAAVSEAEKIKALTAAYGKPTHELVSPMEVELARKQAELAKINPQMRAKFDVSGKDILMYSGAAAGVTLAVGVTGVLVYQGAKAMFGT